MALLVLDTNVIADLLADNKSAREWLVKCRAQGDRVVLCQPIYYEVLRGLLWRNATGKLNILSSKSRHCLNPPIWKRLIGRWLHSIGHHRVVQVDK